MLICLGLAFEIVQFVTQYGFYPEALMRDHPLSQTAFPQRPVRAFSLPLLSSSAGNRDRHLAESLLAAAVLYLSCASGCTSARSSSSVSSRNCGSVASFPATLTELLLIVLASIAAGLAGDFIVAKLRPSARNANAFRFLGLRRAGRVFRGILRAGRSDVRRNVVGREFCLRLDCRGGLVGLCTSQLLLAGTQTPSS